MSAHDKTYTLSDFETFTDQHPDRRFELINGEIIEKMPTLLHSFIVGMLNYFFSHYLQQHPIGWILPEARFRVPSDKENARLPDLAFILKQEGRTLTNEGAAPYMPDLAIEVQSPRQSKDMLREKGRYYLSNGTQVVWIVFPEEKVVEVMTTDGKIEMLSIDDTLTLDTLAPGLTIPLTEVFKDPEA